MQNSGRKSTGSAYQKAKTCVLKERCSVGDLKIELRKQLKQRMREMRSQSLDSHRNITNEDYKREYEQIKSMLLAKEIPTDANALLDALNQVQEELWEEENELEVSVYESQVEDETNSILEMIMCKVCEQDLGVVENDICVKCADKHFKNNEI